jgi:hypothetical protein
MKNIMTEKNKSKLLRISGSAFIVSLFLNMSACSPLPSYYLQNSKTTMVNPSNSVPLPLYGKRSAVDITGSFSYLPEDTNFRFSEGSYYDLSEGTTTNQNNCESSLMRWYGDLSLTFQCLRFAVISTDLKITEFNNHTLYDFGAGGGIRHYNDYVAWIIMMKGYLVKTHHSVSIYETNYGYS